MKLNNILKKNNKYVLIFDDKKVEVYDDIILKYHLLSLKDIDDDLYEKIVNDNNEISYYYKMINYISYKERTEEEIKNKLYKYHLKKDMVLNIIDRLKNEGYLDKNRYLKAFIHDRVNLSQDGPLKIKSELIKLKYNEEEINSLLNDVNDDIWITKINKIISKKIKANHNKSKIMLIKGIKIDLISHGYSSYLYEDILNNIDFNDNCIKEKEYQKLYQKYSGKYDDNKLKVIIERKLKEKGF